MTGEIAIIGNGESALAFKAGGVDAFFADDEKEARELLKKLARTYKVIFVTEDLAEKMDDLITRMLEQPYPAIVAVPSDKGGSGYAAGKMKQYAEMALGADVLFENEKRSK